ncbi:unnamed protein product [Linum tenue]|uniref:Uncharacterized protein n=1 Tax=Linum tenue TaxID=586396 RepID=A0AAV0M201_9ROSI|nr:unnamed protein product [Linum tenue]
MAMKKQAVLIALTWLLVLATIVISAHATADAAAGTVKQPDAFKDPNVAQPMAGCRCCTWFRNQYGNLQCGYVCCTDGCC